MIDVSEAKQLLGSTLTDSDGSKIGKIGQIYLDDLRGQPEWVTVKTGLFGTNESFVPLAEATMTDGDLRVPYSKKQIQGAPNIDDDGELTEAQEQDLYTYYGVPYTTEGSTFADTSKLGGATTGQSADSASTFDSAESHESVGTAGTTGTSTVDAGDTARVEEVGGTTAATGPSTAVGTGDSTSRTADATATTDTRSTTDTTGTSGLTGDDAMTRSEERLDVGTEQVQTGKARLRKWVETENVQVDVPVKREKATLVTEPVTDGNVGDATSGPDITEAEHEVVLTEERPTVSKETVPVERVRLDKEVVEDTETVNDDVRKERIDLEGDAEVAGDSRTGNQR